MIDVDLMMLLVTIASMVMIVSMYPVIVMRISLGLMIVGWISLAIAKFSLFRRGLWISWGTRFMTKRHARLYKAGYALIGVGVLLGLLSRLVA